MSKKQTLFSVLQALLVWAFAMTAYTFLHEFGHAAIGMLAGGSLRHFSINFLDMSASVGVQGDLRQPATSVLQIAGILTPYLIWMIAAQVAPRRRSAQLEAAVLLTGGMTVASLLAWVIIPVLVLFGQQPPDDSTNFLGTTGAPPLLISAIFLGLLVLGLKRWLRRAGSRVSLRTYFGDRANWQGSVSQRDIKIVGLLLAAFLLAAFGLNGFHLTPARGQMTAVPSGFTLARKIDLYKTAFENETVLRFSVATARPAGLFLRLTALDADFIDLTLHGSNQAEIEVFHAEKITSNGYRLEFQQILEPGDYQLLLTSTAAKSGQLEVFSTSRP